MPALHNLFDPSPRQGELICSGNEREPGDVIVRCRGWPARLPDVRWRNGQRERCGCVRRNGDLVKELVVPDLPMGSNETVGRIECRFDPGEPGGELGLQEEVFVTRI